MRNELTKLILRNKKKDLMSIDHLVPSKLSRMMKIISFIFLIGSISIINITGSLARIPSTSQKNLSKNIFSEFLDSKDELDALSFKQSAKILSKSNSKNVSIGQDYSSKLSSGSTSSVPFNDTDSNISSLLLNLNHTQTTNISYSLQSSELTTNTNHITLNTTRAAILTNMSIQEKESPSMILSLTDIINKNTFFSKDVSNGIENESFNYFWLNSSTTTTDRSLLIINKISSNSTEITPSFHVSRSLHFLLGTNESAFSHVMTYPTVFALNLNLKEFIFSTSNSTSVKSDYLLRFGLKFHPSDALNKSTAGGIFYITWKWSTLFSPPSSPMFDTYNAFVGNSANGPVHYFPKNISILDPNLLLILNLTKFIMNIAEYETLDNFTSEKARLYFDSISEIFLEWHVIATDIPPNSTLSIGFSLDELRLNSYVPSTYYNWTANVNQLTLQFDPESGKAKHHSLFLNQSQVNISLNIILIDDVGKSYLSWKSLIYYDLSFNKCLRWMINPQWKVTNSTNTIITGFYFVGNESDVEFKGDLTLIQKKITIFIPKRLIPLLNHTLSESTFINGTSQEHIVNITQKSHNMTHQQMEFSVLVYASLNILQALDLQLVLWEPNEITQVSMASQIILLGDPWFLDGYIDNYLNFSMKTNILDIYFYQNISENISWLSLSHFQIEITSTGYFILYISKNESAKLKEGNAIIVVLWDSGWFHGLFVSYLVLMSNESTPRPIDMVKLNGTNIYQFSRWILSGSLRTNEFSLQGSATVRLLLVDANISHYEDLSRSTTRFLLNETYMVDDIENWSLNLNLASFRSGIYSLFTEWTLVNGLKFYNITPIEILPSTVFFIVDKINQPSNQWLSLKGYLQYLPMTNSSESTHVSKQPLKDNRLSLAIILNESHSKLIESINDPDGTINVFWDDLPDVWYSFMANWTLYIKDNKIISGIFMINNKFETSAGNVTHLYGSLMLEKFSPNPVMTNSSMILSFLFRPSSEFNIRSTRQNHTIQLHANIPFIFSQKVVNSIWIELRNSSSGQLIATIENSTFFSSSTTTLLSSFSPTLLQSSENITFYIYFNITYPILVISSSLLPISNDVITSQIMISKNIFSTILNITAKIPLPLNLVNGRTVRGYELYDANQKKMKNNWKTTLNDTVRFLLIKNISQRPDEELVFHVYWYLSEQAASGNEGLTNFNLFDLFILIATISLSTGLILHKKRTNQSKSSLI